eukprot:3204718-Karenia_brevis.AAC.1
MVEELFANAAFVHPFRHPFFHATQLTDLNFAKNHNRHLVWVALCDNILTSHVNVAKDKEEFRKER